MSCTHPSTSLRAWHARDDSQPTGEVLVIVCLKCLTTIQGGYSDEDIQETN